MLGPYKAMAKTAYIDESGGGKIGVTECVKSGAGKLMELCKNGWDFASLLVSKKGKPCVGVHQGPMRFYKESEAAPDGDVGLRFLKCSLGSTLDKVGTNSVSESGRGTGVGDASVCIVATESVFNKLRTVPAAEFTCACTYVGGLELAHLT